MWRLAGNVLGNQLVYLCAVIGAGRGRVWPAIVAAALFVIWQWAGSRQRAVTLRLILLALGCGALVDGVASASGWVSYAAHPGPVWLAPVWILALWAAFAMTLGVSLAALQRHLSLAAVVGFTLAPLAYLSAARGFDAVRFATPAWRGVLLLGVGWALALPMLMAAVRYWRVGAGVPTQQGVGR
jgi:hypothetical protein